MAVGGGKGPEKRVEIPIRTPLLGHIRLAGVGHFSPRELERAPAANFENSPKTGNALATFLDRPARLGIDKSGLFCIVCYDPTQRQSRCLLFQRGSHTPPLLVAKFFSSCS